jgi:hypothetical protein
VVLDILFLSAVFDLRFLLVDEDFFEDFALFWVHYVFLRKLNFKFDVQVAIRHGILMEWHTFALHCLPLLMGND